MTATSEVVAAGTFPGLHHAVVEPQEVKPLLPVAEADDPSLVGARRSPSLAKVAAARSRACSARSWVGHTTTR